MQEEHLVRYTNRGDCFPHKTMLYLKRRGNMSDALTYEKVLELIKETNRLSSERLEKELRKSQEKFEEKLEKSRIAFEKSRTSFDAEFRKSRKEFDKKIGELTGTLGKFVEGLVKPKLLEMFRQKGIDVTDILHNVEIHDAKGQKETQIDLLLINAAYSIAVEVKTTLNVEGVKEHIKRLDRLQKNPKRYVKGTILLGAVAGMVIQEDADKYAYRKGLYVLKQKGEILEIANDNKFKPRKWIVP